MNTTQQHKLITRIAPWFAGASFAVAHISASTNCTVSREGHCSACGSCAVALATLVTWAVLKKRNVDTDSNSEKQV